MTKAPSVAAMVASRDSHFAQWPVPYSRNPVVETFRKDGKKVPKANEIVMEVGRMLLERLQHWYEANDRSWPEQIIIYRDGLSEDQFKHCKDSEIANMKKALSARFQDIPDQCPRLLVICTIKRHHTRFYREGPKVEDSHGNMLADWKGNPNSGTAVIDGVTYGCGRDFFLVSHKTIQGTSRPTHYVVLRNEIKDLSLQEVAEAVSHLLLGDSLLPKVISKTNDYVDLQSLLPLG